MEWSRTIPEVEAIGQHPAVAFAAAELTRYLTTILTGAPNTTLPRQGHVVLGTFVDLDRQGTPHAPWPEVADPLVDDAVCIAVSDGSGYVAGANPRSVLLAAYRLLRELGCRWVRPGPSGERVPRGLRAPLSASICEVPSYRHRALCIEGAVSYDNVASIIDWAPKVGLNGYFTQFRESFIFFERWYGHRNNPRKAREPFSVERAREFLRSLEGEIARRGLLYHAVGHGWTCEPFGIAGLGWDVEAPTLTPEVRGYLAEVDGARDLWRGVPLNTSLCYSNPTVRSMVVESIVDYLRDHPQVDLLHFWLADGTNNQCECPACRDTRPSDYYVMMLNALDRRLGEEGLAARIVFLVYVDLLWPPERERIANPDRFVLMFAPITRSYRQTFAASEEAPALPPYDRNRLTFPSDPDQNVAFLRAWQQTFRGDSFDFDYHLWRAHYLDPGYMSISDVLSHDIRNLAAIGLNGYVSCQVQRAFFPTGLPMHILARTLWDRDAPLAELAAEHMRAAFGDDAPQAAAYLEGLSDVFALLEPLVLGNPAAADTAALLEDLERRLASGRGLIARNLAQDDACVAQSWQYLEHHRRLVERLAAVLAARAAGDAEGARHAWAALEAYVQTNEDALQPVFDGWAYLEAMRRRLG
jgi:hypothetical protein